MSTNNDRTINASAQLRSRAHLKVVPKLDLSDFDPDGLYWDPLACPRWVRWRLEAGVKIPKRLDGITNAKSNDPSTWTTRAQVQGHDKIGFMLGYVEEEGQYVCGLDLDKCVSNREITNPIVTQIVARFASYTKFSVSGTGLHVMFTMSPADVEWARHKWGINHRKVIIPKNDEHGEVALDFDHRFYAHTEDVTRTRWWQATRADVEWLLGLEPQKGKGQQDFSGSGYGWEFMRERKAAGDNQEQATAKILADKGLAGEWARRVDARQLAKAWQKCNAKKRDDLAPDITPRPLSDYPTEKVQWLWKGFIPRDMVSVWEGEGEAGKSRLTRYVAATASVGGALREDRRMQACNVLIVSFTEDPVPSVIKPQVEKMGGDLDKVFVIDKAFQLNEAGVVALRQAIVQFEAKIVILDPLADYMPRGANPFSDADVRHYIMGPLSEIARELKIAIIAIRHFKKSTEGPLKYRGAGSVGFTNVSRCTVAFVSDPLQPDATVMGITKTNLLHRSERYYLRFQIVKSKDGYGELVWDEELSEQSPEELAEEAKHVGEGGDALEEAKKFLQEQLKNGPVLRNVVIQRAEGKSITATTLLRARQVLGVKIRGGHKGASATWSLNDDI